MKVKIIAALLMITTVLVAGDMRWKNGMKLFNEHQYADALKRFNSLAEEFPNIYQYSMMKGLTEFYLKDTEHALASLKHAYDLKRDVADVAFAYAQVLQATGKYDELNTVLESIDEKILKEKSPNSMDKLYYLRGISRFYKKNFKGAAADLAKVQNPKQASVSAYFLAYSYYRLDDEALALKALSKVTDTKKQKDVLRLKHKILASMTRNATNKEARQKLIDENLQVTKKLVALDPSPDNYYAAGQTALFAGKMEEAIPYLKKAAQSGNAYASYYLSFSYIKAGKLNAAEEAIKAALPKLKGDTQATQNLYCNWGHIYHVRDNYAKAIKMYSKGGGRCAKQLEQAKRGQKAVKAKDEMEILIQQYKALGN